MTVDNDAAQGLMLVSRRLLRVAQVLWAIVVLGLAGPLVWGLAGASFSDFGFSVLFFCPILVLVAGFIVYGQSRRYQNKAILVDAFPCDDA